MYEKDKTLLLVATASAVGNNLSRRTVEGSRVAEAVAVLHGGYINVVPLRSAQGPASRYIPCSEAADKFSASVTQVAWCYLGAEHCMVVASTVGLQVFDSEGLDLKFAHPCRDGGPAESFARGIAAPRPDYLCVGNSSGVVRVFQMYEEGSMAFVDRKQGHRSPVTDLATWGGTLASADEDGCIALWTVGREELLHWANIQSYGSSCTSLGMWKGCLAAGYGSGHVRLFTLEAEGGRVGLGAEVAAHARWVTALDVSPEHGYLLTTSEDSFAKVWQIVRGDHTTLSHKFSSRLKDCMVVGGRFLTPSASLFAVSIYDSNLVQCFRM